MIRVPMFFQSGAFCRATPSAFRPWSTSTSPSAEELHGIFAVDKPAGMTSNDVLTVLKRTLNPRPSPASDVGQSNRQVSKKLPKIKMGHGGTLDPFATGVLVIAVGHGTKSLAQYLGCTKEYVVTGVFGSATDTYDLTGTPTYTAPCSHVTQASLLSVLPHFRGTIMQQPPLYSALKRNGVRLYEIARRATATEKPNALADIPLPDPRPCTIHELELVHWVADAGPEGGGPPKFKLRVKCSKGTYIRSLVHDIGKAAGSAAHAVELRRTRQGEWGEQVALRRETGEWTLEEVRRRIKRTNAKGDFV